MAGTAVSGGSAGATGPEDPDHVKKAKQFFATPFNVEEQAELCSERFEVEYLHSWVRITHTASQHPG